MFDAANHLVSADTLEELIDSLELMAQVPGPRYTIRYLGLTGKAQCSYSPIDRAAIANSPNHIDMWWHPGPHGGEMMARVYRQNVCVAYRTFEIPTICKVVNNWETIIIHSPFTERFLKIIYGVDASKFEIHLVDADVQRHISGKPRPQYLEYLWPPKREPVDLSPMLEELFGKRQAAIITKMKEKSNAASRM